MCLPNSEPTSAVEASKTRVETACFTQEVADRAEKTNWTYRDFLAFLLACSRTGAKSSRSREEPLRTMWLILTAPRAVRIVTVHGGRSSRGVVDSLLDQARPEMESRGRNAEPGRPTQTAPS